MIDTPAGVIFKVLCVFPPRRLGIGERVDQARAVERVLLETVHHLGLIDADHFVECWRDGVDVVGLRTRRPVELNALSTTLLTFP